MKSNKLTKTVIKSIVKECLIEILAEGLMTENTTPNRSAKKSNKLRESVINVAEGQSKLLKRNNKRPTYLDNIKFGEEKISSNPRFEKNIDQLTASITNDPILTEMLKDTAMSTLQEQAAAENSRSTMPLANADAAQKLVSKSEPADIFGAEASSKWAALAFSD